MWKEAEYEHLSTLHEEIIFCHITCLHTQELLLQEVVGEDTKSLHDDESKLWTGVMGSSWASSDLGQEGWGCSWQIRACGFWYVESMKSSDPVPGRCMHADSCKVDDIGCFQHVKSKYLTWFLNVRMSMYYNVILLLNGTNDYFIYR